ncbi:MAG: 30S ribosomal protein S18 [Planctomycetes bacterium]|nr:30S ribosomal protein S18 [Planctomycetota bacterium]
MAAKKEEEVLGGEGITKKTGASEIKPKERAETPAKAGIKVTIKEPGKGAAKEAGKAAVNEPRLAEGEGRRGKDEDFEEEEFEENPDEEEDEEDFEDDDLDDDDLEEEELEEEVEEEEVEEKEFEDEDFEDIEEEIDEVPVLKKPGEKRYAQLSDRVRCRFTRAGVDRIDYKDVMTLQKLMTAQAKVLSRKRTGIAARYQRMIKTAIKRARFMALLPYTG